MSKNQISDIKDQIYFEKLSIILTNIQQWQKGKNQKMNDVYGNSIFDLFVRLQKNGKELNNQMTQFLKMMNFQYSFLSKLKKDDRHVEISPFYKQFREFGDSFGIIKESLLELAQYIGKMMGVTSYQFTQLKRIYDEVDQTKTRFETYKTKHSQQFNQKKQLIYSKKNIKKTFELTKMIDIINDVPKENVYYNELSFKLFAIYERQIQNKQKMYKDIYDNVEFISKLYEKSFQKDMLDNIMAYFKNKLEVTMKQERAYLQNSKLDSDLADKTFGEIEEKFFNYFNQFLEQITITNWTIIYSTKQKEDQRPSKEININLKLTFDNKLIFCPQSKRSLTLQINLEDIKIYKADSNGRFQVKNRKTKQKFYMKFIKMDNQDQFFLHYQQIAQSV